MVLISMAEILGVKFSLRLPQEIIIKLEAEKETIGIKARSKMIEKCIRYYFDNKEENENLKTEVQKLWNEIEIIKEKAFLF